jgi:hypothetical protein
MKLTTRLLPYFAATVSLMAQSPESRDGGEGPPPKPPIPPLMAALDTNQDGEISAEEIKNAADALASIDKNNDGKLSKEEIFTKPVMPPRGESEPRMKRPPPVVDVLDEDHDGTLSAQEMRRSGKALESLDHNQDRELTPDEMFGPPPHGEQPPAEGDRPQRPMPPRGGPPGAGPRGPRR